MGILFEYANINPPEPTMFKDADC